MSVWLFMALFCVFGGFYLQWCHTARQDIFMNGEIAALKIAKWISLVHAAIFFMLFWFEV